MSQVDPAPILHGVRFTSKGFGIQWEETAGAVPWIFEICHFRSGTKKDLIFLKSQSLAWMIFLMDELNGKDHAFTATGRFKPNQILSPLWARRLGSYLFQVIALSHFLAYRSSGSEEEFKDRLRQRLEASRLSLRTLLKMYGAVPASVRGGNGDAYNAHNAYAPYPGGSDTGMGFSYLRMIHVASALPLTARVGCFVLLWV